MSDIKYPDCVVELSGSDGNAAAMIGMVGRKLRRHLIDEQNWTADSAAEEVRKFQQEASSGDYDNVIGTCARWVDVF
jgi:hypothetical protein